MLHSHIKMKIYGLKNTRRRGFTLMESLLAIGLVGVLLSIFLTVFVPARGMVRQALTRQEAERISGILRSEMSRLRADEEVPQGATQSSSGKYLSTFDKGFYWVQFCKNPSSAIVVFSYRADMSKPARADGSYPPVPASRSVPGKNTQLVSMACPINDPLHKDSIRDAVGPVFLVKMTHLVRNGHEYRPVNSPGTIAGASSPGDYVSSAQDDSPWGGFIVCRADFYHMSPPNPARYRGKSWNRIGRPLFSTNISFHR